MGLKRSHTQHDRHVSGLKLKSSMLLAAKKSEQKEKPGKQTHGGWLCCVMCNWSHCKIWERLRDLWRVQLVTCCSPLFLILLIWQADRHRWQTFSLNSSFFPISQSDIQYMGEMNPILVIISQHPFSSDIIWKCFGRSIFFPSISGPCRNIDSLSFISYFLSEVFTVH